jgi:outer membrane lipoprotein SlyB
MAGGGPESPLALITGPAGAELGGEGGDWIEQKIRNHFAGDELEHSPEHEHEHGGEDYADEEVNETVGVTDYNPKSQGGTRKELLAKYSKSGDSKHAESARKAGATQSELKAARSNMNKEDVDEGAFARALSHLGGIGGAAIGHKASKGNQHGAKSGHLIGKAVGDTAGQWIDNKVDKWLNRSPSDSSATDDDDFATSYTPKKQAEPAAEKPAAPAAKTRTGGKKPGETSETPEAKRKREARAKAKSGKTSNTAPAMSESGNWLEGQYGHSGKMKPVTGGDADTIARLRFLSGITK